jgi:hypothetical protein
MEFWGSCSINMALLTELSQSLIPLETAKSPLRCPKTLFPRRLRRGGRFFAVFDGMALLTPAACRYPRSHTGAS